MTDREDVLKELGQMATERRESIGMTLETVFDRTKIRMEYLRGSEARNYEGFPEPVYIKGFIRTYLKLINAEDLQEDFMAQIDRSDSTPSPKKHDANPKNLKNILGNGSSIPKGFKPASHFWVFLVLIVALVGTGLYVWYAVSYGGLDLKNLKLFNFSGAGGPLAANISNDTEITGFDREIQNVSISEDISEDEEQEEEVPSSLEIRAVNDVWLSVAFGNAQPVYRRTLRRGESVRWDLSETARVVIGRPSAAQVILNGQDLGVVNPRARSSETYIYNPDGTYNLAPRRSR